MARVRIRNLTRRSIAVPGVGVLVADKQRTAAESPEIRELEAAGALAVEPVPPPEPRPHDEQEATE